MLRDNKLRPLNSGPYLPMLSEGASNWSDLPIESPCELEGAFTVLDWILTTLMHNIKYNATLDLINFVLVQFHNFRTTMI